MRGSKRNRANQLWTLRSSKVYLGLKRELLQWHIVTGTPAKYRPRRTARKIGSQARKVHYEKNVLKVMPRLPLFFTANLTMGLVDEMLGFFTVARPFFRRSPRTIRCALMALPIQSLLMQMASF